MTKSIYDYLESQLNSSQFLIGINDLKRVFPNNSSREISLAIHMNKKYEVKKYYNNFIFLPRIDSQFCYYHFLDDLMKKLNLEYHICLDSAVALLIGDSGFEQKKILVKIKKHKERWLDLIFENGRIDFIGDKDFTIKTQIVQLDDKQLIVSTPEQTLIDIFKYSKYTDPYSKKAQLGRKIIMLVDISKLEGLITLHICQYHMRVLMYFLEENGFEIKHLLYRYDEESKKPPYSMRNYQLLDSTVTSNVNKHKGLRLYLP